MAVIEVRHSSGDEWSVTVHGSVTTHHRVTVTKSDIEHLGQGGNAEGLLRKSFEFLLERESNTSILPSFDLPLIGHYFPEYESQIQARLRHAT